jgi:sialate O-acetylesterase
MVIMRKFILGFIFFYSIQVQANVSLPRFISNGVVLQREVLIPIWGWANPGEKVQVSFKGKNYYTTTNANRKWNIQLDISSPGGPYELIVKGGNLIKIEDVLVGDVWFCSGQSNMEYELYKAAEKYPNEIATSANDLIRNFQVKRNHSFDLLEDLNSDKGWEKASPTTVPNFSAIAYFFARQLYEKYKIPIGLVNASYGGTPAEAWMSEEALIKFPQYHEKALFFKEQHRIDSVLQSDKDYLDQWNKKVASLDMGEKENWSKKEYKDCKWGLVEMPSFWQEKILPEVKAGTVWFKKEINLPAKFNNQAAVLRLGNIIIKDETFVNGYKVGSTSNKHAPRKYAIQSNIIKSGLNTITVKVTNEMGDAGFIKDKRYQLEIGDTIIYLNGQWKYNTGVSVEPFGRDNLTKFFCEGTALYNAMVNPVVGYAIKGVIWYQGESNQSKAKEYRSLFPDLIKSWRTVWGQGDFPFVWVQLANINKPKEKPSESKLAELQDAQSNTLQLPNTGMAVINDIGEWNDVHPMNKLEAARRLYLAALKTAYNEKDIVYSGPTLIKSEIVNNTIELTFNNIGSGLVAKETGKLAHFAIADEQKKYVWAEAYIKGDKVVVSSSQIAHPKFVRYAWADNPVGANLYNKEGLPASCFNTENNYVK